MSKRLISNKHLRKAQRGESTFLYRIENEKCLEMDEKSYQIFQYIQNTTPTEEQVFSHFGTEDILREEIERFINWLLETEFISEI
ncbi:MAG: hypothetical protein Q4C65_10840 [Eubacteriales bacterium]|nr:hypothetical protein [Eubacteriales bacterium]